MNGARWLIVCLTFVVAFVLNLIPLPGWVLPYRPDWVVLVLIYWCMAIPDRFGTGMGWLIGLLVDATNANLLGVHALGMATLAYLTSRLHPYCCYSLYIRVSWVGCEVCLANCNSIGCIGCPA